MNEHDTIIISEKKIQDLYKQCLHLNIFPIFISHYLDLEKNKKNPVSKIACSLYDEILIQIDKMTELEYECFVDSFTGNFKFMIDHDKNIGKKNKDRVAMIYLMARLYKVKFSLKNAIITNFKNSEVYKVYPELIDCLDEDELLKIDDRFILHDGGIEYKDHILHYSQFLRRGFNSNPNFDFFYHFINYYNDSREFNNFRISIDFNRLMPKEFYSQYFECDTWYGVHFDIKKIDNPNEIGITIVGRNENSLFKLDNKLERTEFFWSYRNFIKTLQIEEINGLDGKMQNYYINRYIHSQRDIKSKKFFHLDGAVKIYLDSEYKNRYDTRIDNKIKAYKKIKLFRIDSSEKGQIDLTSWIELISFFLKSNEMIIEYFNPEEFVKLFDERVRDFEKWKKSNINEKSSNFS